MWEAGLRVSQCDHVNGYTSVGSALCGRTHDAGLRTNLPQCMSDVPFLELVRFRQACRLMQGHFGAVPQVCRSCCIWQNV